MTFKLNQIFEGTYPPEAAVWGNENNAYIVELDKVPNPNYGKEPEVPSDPYAPMPDPEPEFLRRFQIVAITAPSLDELKAAKLKELESSFLAYRSSKSTYTDSSLGFKVNANATAYMDVDGLIGVLQATPKAGEAEPTVAFMDFDNESHDLTVGQLNTIKNEISLNGTRAYGVKWAYREKVEAATSEEELSALTFTFDPVPESEPSGLGVDGIGTPTL